MPFGQEHETSIVSQSLLMLRKDLKLLGRRMTGDEWKTIGFGEWKTLKP